jgi:penicillin-binding protein-related factor A (putative recombinase)
VTNESDISRKLRHALAAAFPGSFWWKNAGSEFGQNGMPDLMGIVKGRLFGIEVKRGNNWFTPLQVDWLKKINNSGGSAFGMSFADKVYVIPTTAMGSRGNHHRELWIEISYPDELSTLEYLQ